ncbi:hypothetical protein CVT24_007631 [Panaeolus cyanescens]|uniref:G domain-containing protein n=1 Tax=Panaeolus cyanescens TaxID=181874 RepID=A0A409W598_9AGAR|nr:hypothetical protein CVT24_007631 [Panaeolus cyanescens]
MSQRYQLCANRLAGPTGAGKSTFLEALAGDKSLQISKDQLEGCTQTVTAYEIENACFYYTGEDEICLLDSPGFSDSDISEAEIVEMVTQWLQNHNADRLHSLLYFCPITDIRLPGSRRRTINMLKSFIKASNPSVNGLTNDGSLTIATTMWDNVWNERVRERAEKNYAQLKDNVFEDMIANGAGIAKFMNTQSSSLHILDSSRVSWGNANGNAYSTYRNVQPLGKMSYGRFIYTDLLERIEAALQLKQILEFDLKQAKTFGDRTLAYILEGRLQTVERVLGNFVLQLQKFGEPPEGMPAPSTVLSLMPGPSETLPQSAHHDAFDAPVATDDQERPPSQASVTPGGEPQSGHDSTPMNTTDQALAPMVWGALTGKATKLPNGGRTSTVLKRQVAADDKIGHGLLRGLTSHRGQSTYYWLGSNAETTQVQDLN